MKRDATPAPMTELHERLCTIELLEVGTPTLRESKVLWNFLPAPLPLARQAGTPADGHDTLPAVATVPESTEWLNERALVPFLEETRKDRLTEVERIAQHVELSLTELLQRADEEIAKAQEAVDRGDQAAEGRLAQAEARHKELLQRRERRRKELDRQRALSLQAEERMASILVLPHPEHEAPEVQRLQPNPETEAVAMRMVMEYERSQGRQVYDVSKSNLGYDITGRDLSSGEFRLIGVKGRAGATRTVLLPTNERRVAEDRRDCYWLYVVTACLPVRARTQTGRWMR